MRTLAILPVKTFGHAKQRLEPDVDGARRRALAEAMFADVLVALRRAGGVERTLVVTADRGAQQLAALEGAEVLDDLERGHNEAARRGIAHALAAGFERALLVPGDCPALDPEELDELLGRAVEPPSAVIVPDRHGTGTNALLLTPPDALPPAFGPGSRERHASGADAVGTWPEVVDVPTLALDVDTPEDLAVLEQALAARHGGAAHTRGLLSQFTRSRC